MIERGWFDRDFVRDWTNGPLLVRDDTGRLLREADLDASRQRRQVRRLGRAARPAGGLRPGRPAATSPTARPRARRRVRGRRRRRATSPAAPCSHALRRALPPLRPERGRGDHRRRRRRDRGTPPACSGSRGPSPTTPGAASSSRPTPRRSPAPSRQLYALTGSFDVPGGNVLFPAVPANRHRRRGAAARADAPRRSACRTGRSARRAGSTSPPDELYDAVLDAAAIHGARPGRLRRQSAAGPCRRPARRASPGGARLLRPRRSVHEPDRRAGRHRAAGRQRLRDRGAEDRLRSERGGAVAGPASAARGRAARRGALGHRDRLRPGRAASAWASISRTATSRRPTAISSARPA